MNRSCCEVTPHTLFAAVSLLCIASSVAAQPRNEQGGPVAEATANGVPSAGAAAFEKGVSALAEKNFQEATASLRDATRLEPDNGRYRHALAIALLNSNQGAEGWMQLRTAVRLEPRNEPAARDFIKVWTRLDGQGIFNVGAKADSVTQLLGKPDAVQGSQDRPQWIYGFMSVNFAGDQVYSVLDMRNLPAFGAHALTQLRVSLDNEPWRPGHRLVTGSQVNVEYVLGEETVQNWHTLFSSQRLIGTATRMTARQTMEKIRQSLEKISPQLEFRVLADADKDVLYEWKIPATGKKSAQHELVRLVQDERDIHRIAYVAKTETIPAEKREIWLSRLRNAKLVPLTDAVGNSDADAEKLKQVSRAIMARQLELIRQGDAASMKQFFTPRLHDRITPELLEKAKQGIEKVTPEQLVHELVITQTATGPVAKIRMKSGRTLTTLIVVNRKWVADTIWFQ